MRKRGFTLFGIVVLTLLIAFLIRGGAVETTLSIVSQAIPPVLIAGIPDQTWAVNTNVTNAFDLDDHFLDNETLTYTNSSVDNITIVINSTTNEVSFFSDLNFEGERTVIFTASDATSSTNSNTVTLNVTNDTEPPGWSSPAKEKLDAQIFQNLIVTFTSVWQDNVALFDYFFSIKQESGWVNQSPSRFTGTSNTSSYAIQISAPSGTQVLWRFYGRDTSGNINSTAIQNFTVATSPPIVSNDSDPDETTTTTSETTETASSADSPDAVEDFIIDPLGGFLIDVKQGASGAVTIKITNTGNTDLFFEIKIEDLEEFDQLISDSSFNLTGGEQKSVTIEFTADRRIMPDIYYGVIKVESSVGKQEIPIAITVNPVIVDFDLQVNVSEEYKKVSPGEIVKANITITNVEEVEERNVTFYYAIANFKGEVVDSAFEEFTFNARSIELERELSLPTIIRRGEYIFFARAVSGENIVIGSDVFEVGEEFNVAGFVRTNFLLLLIVVSSIVFAIMMMRHYKNKERLRLLNLYLMISELNKLIKKGKHEEAVEVYVKIKRAYGEPVSNTALKNKGELKVEMENLSKKLEEGVLNKIQKSEEGKEGEKKESVEGGEKTDKKEGEGKSKEENQESGSKDEKKEVLKDAQKTGEKSGESEKKDVKEGKAVVKTKAGKTAGGDKAEVNKDKSLVKKVPSLSLNKVSTKKTAGPSSEKDPSKKTPSKNNSLTSPGKKKILEGKKVVKSSPEKTGKSVSGDKVPKKEAKQKEVEKKSS